jgi:hypothetical protein
MSTVDAMNVPRVRKQANPITEDVLKEKLPAGKYKMVKEKMEEVNEGFMDSYQQTVSSKYNLFSIGPVTWNGEGVFLEYVGLVIEETEKVIVRANFSNSTIDGKAVDWKGTIMVGGPDRLRLACMNFMLATIAATDLVLLGKGELMKKRIAAYAETFCIFMWQQGGPERKSHDHYEFAYSSAHEMCRKIWFQPVSNLEHYVDKFLWMVNAADIIEGLAGYRTRYVPTVQDYNKANGVVSFLKTGQIKHAIFAEYADRQMVYRFVCTRLGTGQSGHVTANTEVKLTIKSTVTVSEDGELNWEDIRGATTGSIANAFAGIAQGSTFADNAGAVMASMWMSIKCASKKTYLQKSESLDRDVARMFGDVIDENGDPVVRAEQNFQSRGEGGRGRGGRGGRGRGRGLPPLA